MGSPKRDTTPRNHGCFKWLLAAAGIARKCVLLCAASLHRVEAIGRHIRGRQETAGARSKLTDSRIIRKADSKHSRPQTLTWAGRRYQDEILTAPAARYRAHNPQSTIN